MLSSIFRIVALVRKELLVVLKDPRSRISLFAPPIFQCLIFGYAASYDLNSVPYAVLDQAHSVASQELLARLDGSGIFVRVANLERLSDINSYINRGQALIVIQIGQDFERRLEAGEPSPVQVIADGRNSNTAGTATSYLAAIIDDFNSDWQGAHGLAYSPVRITTRAWYNPNLETRWDMIPALLGTLTMLQTLLLTALSVAREREEGTFDQLLITPLRPTEIMVGKALPCMLIGAVQATSILLLAQFWFRVPFAGSFVTLYLGLALFLLAAVGIGLLVSSVVATMQQAMLFAFVLLMPFTLLSGLTTPVGNMPPALQYFTLIDPLRYAIDIAHRIYLEGAGFGQLLPEFWPLAVIGTVTLAVASWMFRNRVA